MGSTEIAGLFTLLAQLLGALGAGSSATPPVVTP